MLKNKFNRAIGFIGGAVTVVAVEAIFVTGVVLGIKAEEGAKKEKAKRRRPYRYERDSYTNYTEES